MNHLLLTVLAMLVFAEQVDMLFLSSRLLAAQDESEVRPSLPVAAELDEICMDMPWLASCQGKFFWALSSGRQHDIPEPIPMPASSR